MAATSVVVEGILMIAAIITASIFASTFFVKLMEMRDVMSGMARGYSERLKTSIMIIYATYFKDQGYFVVYAKNIGKSSIFIKRMNIYFGNTTKMDLYLYNYDGIVEKGEWDYVEVDGVSDGLWNPGETLTIYIYNMTSIEPPYTVKIVAPNGYKTEETFAPLT